MKTRKKVLLLHDAPSNPAPKKIDFYVESCTENQTGVDCIMEKSFDVPVTHPKRLEPVAWRS